MPTEMKNGRYPQGTVIPPRLRELQRLLMDLAQTLDFVEQSVLLLFSSVIDLSDRSGSEKKQHYERVIKAVLQLHRESWSKRVALSRSPRRTGKVRLSLPPLCSTGQQRTAGKRVSKGC